MRSKSPKPFWVKSAFALLAGLALTPAAHALSVTPLNIPNQVLANSAQEQTLYLLHSTYPAVGTGTVAPGFSRYNLQSAATIFTFLIQGSNTSTGIVWVYAEGPSGVTPSYPIPLSGCDYTLVGSPQLNGCNHGANADFKISLSLQQICATGQAIKGCAANTVDVTTNPIPGFRLHFIEAASATVPTTAAPGDFLQIVPETVGPSLTTVPPNPGFVPGDTAVIVDTSSLLANAQNGGSSTFVTDWLVATAASNGSIAAGTEFNLPASGDDTAPNVQGAVGYAAASQQVGGFKNSDDAASATFYNMVLGVQDSAGAVTFTSEYSNVFATDIQGFLRESNCFIATASFRDGRAPGVMLLRHFRDEVLARFDFGRDFIGWYYAYGPLAADWLLGHPIFRSAALMALIPLQILAWIALHPSVLLAPLFALLALLCGLAIRGRKGRAFPAVFFLAAILAAASPKARASDQPYIDSLISGLPKEATPTAEQPQPYIDSLRKKMTKNADDDATGYTEDLRKEVPKSDGSEGYTQRIQGTLPRETGSAIEDYRKGKKLKANKGSLDTRSAFGFDILAGATRTYTSGENTLVSYDEVYGDGWIPELSLHYEWRPFTSSFLKKFGLFTSLGASFTKAKGKYAYRGPGDEFPAESDVDFRFIAIPANVGLIYRFSVFDFMWPYFGGGPSVIGFTETRNDKQPGNHGYDLGYWFMGGVAFGLDWISPKSSWDQYESTGVKHSYFTIDYSYLESVSGGLIEFTVDGVRLGFTFEL